MVPVYIGIGIAMTVLLLLCVRFVAREKKMVANFRVEKEKANKANEAKSVFLAHMSHEIRTPINAVMGMNEMILRECKDHEIRQYAFDIQSAAQTLQSIINDLLDFTKIEAGRLEIIPVEYELSRLIDDVQNLVGVRAKEKNLELIVDVDENLPSRLYGDEGRVRQVLMNLLSNAIKYTNEGQVELCMSGRCLEGHVCLRYEVKDTGVGIKEEDLSKLEVAFERIEENKNKSIGGVGIGITISQNLLKMMGSELYVESTYGEGSNFYFDLEQKVIDSEPIGKLDSKSSHEEYMYQKAFTAPNAHILVVDDNAVNRKVVRNLLKETQIQITDASSGEECLELVKENYYDLIFMDYMMPQMDGIETLKALKKLEDSPCMNTPVVVLTANAVVGARESYLQVGFDAFLSKPITGDKLEKMICRFLPKESITIREDNNNVYSADLVSTKEDNKEAVEKEQLPDIDGINWDYAYVHLSNADLIVDTAREVYKTIDMDADYVEQLYNNLDQDDNLNLYRIKVHAMKSSMATIGAASMSGLARLLELAAKEKNIDVIERLNALFLKEFRSYKEKLSVFLEEEQKEEVEDVSLIIEMLELLKKASDKMNVDRMDEMMKKLNGYQYSEAVQPLIEALDLAVMSFKLGEISTLTDAIAEKLNEERD